MLICSVFHLSVQNSKSLLFFFKFLELKYIQERKGNIHFLKKTPTKCHVMCTWSLLLFSCQVMSDSDPMDCCTPGFSVFTISQSLLKFMSIELVMLSNHFILYYPLLLLPSIFPSIRVFSSELALRIRCSQYWSFSSNINPSNGYSELIPLRIDWYDLLAVQGTLKSLLQHHNSKASIL